MTTTPHRSSTPRFAGHPSAEEALRRTAALLRQTEEISRVGGWEYDVASNHLVWSEEVYRIHDVPNDFDANDLTQTIAFYHGDSRERIDTAFRRALERGEPYDLELELLTAKGRKIWVRAIGRAELSNGQVMRIYGNIADISERKHADVEIHRLNSELEQRVHDRTAQLEAANKELEAFSFSVSHDLRSPLRAIDSFSRMLVEDNGPQLNDEGRRLLGVIRSESKRMGQLIDDLLSFSRLGRQRMDDSAIDLTELARTTFEDVTRNLPAVPRLELKALPPAHGDRAMLRQVWLNLIENAVKFSRQRAEPVITIEGFIADEHHTYTVTDHGVGFDPRFAGKLFGVFQRLHSEEEFEGTGVGLALVQRIIHRHGGTVAATGKLHGGAAFQFTLPKSINEKT